MGKKQEKDIGVEETLLAILKTMCDLIDTIDLQTAAINRLAQLIKGVTFEEEPEC